MREPTKQKDVFMDIYIKGKEAKRELEMETRDCGSSL